MLETINLHSILSATMVTPSPFISFDKRRWLFSIFLLLFLIQPCRAAFISELSMTARTVLNSNSQSVSLSSYVEISDLTGLSSVDMVIIDAKDSPTRYGQILQVITFASVGPGRAVRVASDTNIPASLYGSALPTGTVTVTPTALNLAGSRSLLLFDRVTGLTVGSKINLTATASAGDKLLDVLTYNSTGLLTRSASGETIYDMSHAAALARTYSSIKITTPDETLIGNPDNKNRLTNYSPNFTLNPGVANDIWTQKQATAIPLPTTGMLLAAGLTALMTRRSRRVPLTAQA